MQSSETLKRQNTPVENKKEKQEKNVSKEDQSYWEMMIDGIVRPPRAKYHEAQLGKWCLIFRQQSCVLQGKDVCEG